MENANKMILIAVLTVAFILVGGSYSYYEAEIQGNGNTLMHGSANTASIEDLILTGTTEVVNNNMIPGESSSYSFSVENPNDFPVCFDIYFDNLTNTFVNTSDLEVSLSNKIGLFPTNNETVISSVRINSNTLELYTLNITYKDVLGKDQTGDISKSFSGTIKARASSCTQE